MLQDYVRQLVRQRIGPAAGQLSLVVDDQPAGTGADRQGREAGIGVQELLDAFGPRAFCLQVAQGDHRDPQMSSQVTAVQAVMCGQAELGAQGQGDPLGLRLEARA